MDCSWFYPKHNPFLLSGQTATCLLIQDGETSRARHAVMYDGLVGACHLCKQLRTIKAARKVGALVGIPVPVASRYCCRAQVTIQVDEENAHDSILNSLCLRYTSIQYEFLPRLSPRSLHPQTMPSWDACHCIVLSNSSGQGVGEVRESIVRRLEWSFEAARAILNGGNLVK